MSTTSSRSCIVDLPHASSTRGAWLTHPPSSTNPPVPLQTNTSAPTYRSTSDNWPVTNPNDRKLFYIDSTTEDNTGIDNAVVNIILLANSIKSLTYERFWSKLRNRPVTCAVLTPEQWHHTCKALQRRGYQLVDVGMVCGGYAGREVRVLGAMLESAGWDVHKMDRRKQLGAWNDTSVSTSRTVAPTMQSISSLDGVSKHGQAQESSFQTAAFSALKTYNYPVARPVPPQDSKGAVSQIYNGMNIRKPNSRQTSPGSNTINTVQLVSAMSAVTTPTSRKDTKNPPGTTDKAPSGKMSGTPAASQSVRPLDDDETESESDEEDWNIIDEFQTRSGSEVEALGANWVGVDVPAQAAESYSDDEEEWDGLGAF